MNKTIIFPSAGNVELQDRECPKDSKWSTYIHYPMTLRRTKIELGNRVVVYGAGVIGQVLIRYLLAGGCTEIVVVNRSQKRLEYIPKSPAVIPVSSETESVMDAVKQVTQGELADIVFETTGNADLIPEEFKMLHQQGKLCMLSSPRKETKIAGYAEKLNGSDGKRRRVLPGMGYSAGCGDCRYPQ